MEKRGTTLNSRAANAVVSGAEGRARKVLPIKAQRAPSIESKPAPASHFGCVDWYMYEHSYTESNATEEV